MQNVYTYRNMQVDWECGEKDSITPITMLHGSRWLLQSSFLAVFFSMVTATSVIGQSLFRIMGSVFPSQKYWLLKSQWNASSDIFSFAFRHIGLNSTHWLLIGFWDVDVSLKTWRQMNDQMVLEGWNHWWKQQHLISAFRMLRFDFVSIYFVHTKCISYNR